MKKLLIVLSILLACNTSHAQLAKVQKYEYFNNNKGLNDKLSPIVIDDAEASALNNVEYTLGGAIKKRNGFASDNNVYIAGSHTGLYEYVTSAGSRYLIQTGADKIYKQDNADGWADNITGAVTISSSSNYIFDFTTANGNLIATNRVDSVIRWTGAGNVTNIAAAPKGQWIAFHNNIVFIANTSTHPSRLLFSNILDETT